jgi:squalene-hopene/tetraprenyl-beta-curcumene cyclase
MKKTIICAAAACCLVTGLSATRPRAEADPSASWNRKAAAAYLDQRATWWTTWPNAQRDHGTFCVSCHTALPYALARPALGQSLGETAASPAEAALLANITKRVTMWRDVEPFYPDQLRGIPKTSESRATEAILNAVILSRRDARTGALSDEGRRALDNMWALQMKTGEQTGAWTWLQFHNEPWEGDSSAFHGATLAAIAIHAAPGGYAASPENQDRVKALHDYLRKGNEQQPLLSRAMLLIQRSQIDHQCAHPEHHEHEHDHEHDETITSVGLRLAGDLNEKKLNEWVRELLMTMGPDIFRMKGILSIKGEPRRAPIMTSG